jgi:hypothetical protein
MRGEDARSPSLDCRGEIGLSADMGVIWEGAVLGAIAAGISFILLFDGSASGFLPNLKKSRFRGFPPLSASVPVCAASVSSEGVASDIKGAVESLDSVSAARGAIDLLGWDIVVCRKHADVGCSTVLGFPQTL